jgi:hypothetical protein
MAARGGFKFQRQIFEDEFRRHASPTDHLHASVMLESAWLGKRKRSGRCGLVS